MTAAILLFGLAGGASGQAIEVTVGKVRITGDGDFAPKRLPADRRAPVRLVNLRGSLRNLDANDDPIPIPFPEPNPRQPVQDSAPEGSRPPIVSRIIADFDRRGSIDTRGLPVCKEAQLRNQTYMVAKRRCGNALIAEGTVNGVVDFPDQKPIVAPGNLLMFNGGPKKIIFHAWANPDVPTAFVVPARITKAPGKRYGHRITSNVPRVANDNGAATDFRLNRVFKTWRHKGKKRSYLGARCNKPRRFSVRVRVEFAEAGRDSAFPQSHPPMQLQFTRPCKTRR